MRKWLPLVAICLGAFMLLIDVSIVNVALPKMSGDLHSSFTSLQWVVDMYALVLAALLLVVGSVGDRVGHRRLYVGGLILFALASLACGLAPGAGALIAARAVQGLGAAAMFTSTTALLNATYQGRDRGTAFGVWGGVNGSAAAVGPILGGLLTEQFGWRSIFLVNLPIAVIGVVMALRVLKESRNPAAAGRLDYAGGLAFTVAAGAATYALIESADKGWGSSTVLGLLVVSAVALLLFVVIELRAKAALLDLALFRRPTFVGLMICALLFPAAAFSHLTYTSIWLQSVLGLSPIEAGLAVSPLALASFVVAAGGGRFLHKLAPQLVIGVGLFCTGGGTLLLMAVSTNSSWPALVPGLLLSGVGVGMVSPILMSAVLGAVPPQRAGMASGAVNTFRQLGYALGIAILGTVFADRLRSVGGAQAAAVVTGGHGTLSTAGQQLVRHASALSLDRIFLFAGCAALVAGVAVLVLVRRNPPPAWAAGPAAGRTESAAQVPDGATPVATGH
jgi:EmrB/QacA subfamily drug resistance transporter